MFLDKQERTLSYLVSVPSEYSGTVEIAGEVTFDEESKTTEGDTQAVFQGTTPVIKLAIYSGLVLERKVGTTYVIEYSQDNVAWAVAAEVTLTEPTLYWADLSSYGQSRRFYRAKVKE